MGQESCVWRDWWGHGGYYSFMFKYIWKETRKLRLERLLVGPWRVYFLLVPTGVLYLYIPILPITSNSNIQPRASLLIQLQTRNIIQYHGNFSHFKGVYIDPSWSPFEYLLEVVSVADQKYHKEISLRNKPMIQFKSLNHTQFKKLKHHKKRTLSNSPSTSKNPRVVTRQAGPDPPPDVPKEFENIIMAKNGSDLKLVTQKKLSKTDMLGRFARLSIPKGQTIAEFLSEDEQMSLQQKEEDGVRYKGMKVQLIQPSLEECSISLKKWKQGSNNSYMLCSPWNEIAKNNGLEVGDILQLWSFKVDHSPCLILIKL